jgi:hypothetical protein
LPSAVAASYASQLDSGSSTLTAPNLHPDMVAKAAFDPTTKLHFEVGGVLRSFRVYDPIDTTQFTSTGGGVQANFGSRAVQRIPRARRRRKSIAGALRLQPVRFEFTRHRDLFFAYYGGICIGRDVAIDTTGKPVGYGYNGSSNGQNRAIQEATFGMNHTFWKDPRYGALAFIGQYS